MRRICNRKAATRAIDVSIDRELRKAAREFSVNLLAVIEEAPVNRVAATKREAWIRENADAIASYNEFVAEHGVYSDGSRSF